MWQKLVSISYFFSQRYFQGDQQGVVADVIMLGFLYFRPGIAMIEISSSYPRTIFV